MSRVEVLHEPLNGSTLAGGIAALKNHRDALSLIEHPTLHLEQFDLQAALGELVVVSRHAFVVGVVLAPRVDRRAVRTEQYGVVNLVESSGYREPTFGQLFVGELLQTNNQVFKIDDRLDVEVMLMMAAHDGALLSFMIPARSDLVPRYAADQ